MGDGILDIADGSGETNDKRLQVDTRKWLLSKALPKIYGDRLDLKATITKTHEAELEELGVLERIAAEHSGTGTLNASPVSVAPAIKRLKITPRHKVER